MPSQDKAKNARKESPLSVALATQLRAERAAANMTVEELARRSGVSRNSLLAVLNGQRPADVSQLDAICKALGVPMILMWERTEARMRSEAPRDMREASGG